MILDDIIVDVRAFVETRKVAVPADALRATIESLPEPIDMTAILGQPGVSIIAEVKRASPSKGALNLGLDAAERAAVYASAGASAISVLTERSRFRGNLEDLREARRGVESTGQVVPLLRKDFIIDSYQLLEARAWGADAALLIVAALDDETLAALARQAQDLGLTPLIEVHNRQELDRALTLKPTLLGINNRNLHDFSVDLNTTRELRSLVPPDCLVVSESGIHEPSQVRKLAEMGVDAALVGEALVKATDPAAKLMALKEAGQ